MSQQDVQTVREGYEAFNRKDIPRVLQNFDPQIEWNEPGGGRSAKGVFQGAQTVAEKVFSLVPENFDEFSVGAEQFIDSGDHVVVV
jgi:ketosteroid isomerase-like protein